MGPWTLSIPVLLVSTMGLLLNAYVLLIVIGLNKQTQQQQNANTLLLIHLGVVEIALCLVLLVFAIGSWSIAGTWCILHGFLLSFLHPIALWTVTGLNCDRYYAIAAPLHYTVLVSSRRVVLGIGLSWTGALLLCLPPFLGLVPPYQYVPGLGCCAPDFGNMSWGSAGLLYGVIYAFLGVVLPAFLVTICNIRILGIARYHRHRIASAIYEVTLSAQVTITHQRNPFFMPTVTVPVGSGPPKFHSAANIVMQLVGSLYLLYFPYCGLILWEACGGSEVNEGVEDGSSIYQSSHLYVQPSFISLASLLLACSPPINGLLYGIKSQTLRKFLQHYWRKKATKSELQQEIQARTPSIAGSRRPSGSVPNFFFPFTPVQRRLSEALLALSNYRRNGKFDSENAGEIFHRTRLQPAASDNTLRVPNSELGKSKRLVRSSTSMVSLIATHYRNEFSIDVTSDNELIKTDKCSPKILITRACSDESQGDDCLLLSRNWIPPMSFPPYEKRTWHYRNTKSNNSTENCETSVWSTGMQTTKLQNDGNFKSKLASTLTSDLRLCGRSFTRIKVFEEDRIVFTDTTNSTRPNFDTKDTEKKSEHRQREDELISENEDKVMVKCKNFGIDSEEHQQEQQRVVTVQTNSSNIWSFIQDTVQSPFNDSKVSINDDFVIYSPDETSEYSNHYNSSASIHDQQL